MKIIDVILVSLVLVLLLSSSVASADQGCSLLGRGNAKNAKIQGAIGSIVGTLREGEGIEVGKARSLEDAAGGDRKELLIQLAIYLSGSNSTEEAMGGALILDRLKFTDIEKVDAIVPCLDEADARLRKTFFDILGTIDHSGDGECDFQFYASVIRSRGVDRSSSLINYMYIVSPRRAFVTLVDLYMPNNEERRDVLGEVQFIDGIIEDAVRGKVIGDSARVKAREYLDRIASHRFWWVRLYAASILARVPGLGFEKTMLRLKNDPSDLIRNAIRGRVYGL